MWVLTRLVSLPAWEIFGAIIVAIGGTLLIVNQVEISFQRHKKKISRYSDKEVEATIREWVDLPSLLVQRKETPDDLLFLFVVTHSGYILNILRAKKEPSTISIVANAVLPLEGLTRQDRNTVAGRIAVEMARLGIQFWMTYAKINNKEVGQTEVQEIVTLDDSLTPFYFRQRVMFVLRALVLIQQAFGAYLAEKGLPPNEPNPHKEGSQP